LAIINAHAEKILKLLSLTRSENDHEALSAIRTANKILAAHGNGWESFLSGGETLPPPPASPRTQAPSSPTLDLKTVMTDPMAYITEALSDPKFARRKSGDFLRSLADYFAAKGCLTERQATWVIKLHAEAMAEAKRAGAKQR
jgi:hypothetical protein